MTWDSFSLLTGMAQSPLSCLKFSPHPPQIPDSKPGCDFSTLSFGLLFWGEMRLEQL